jgi:2-(1,2-epoxy-1,2-dihydrophenyl)acetyl-CoA isomerase
MADVLEVQDEGRLRVLRMNRPERKNALNGALIDALHRELRVATEDDDVWAIALTGNGDAFCAGLDFTDPPTGGDGAPRGHLTVLMRVECEKPIVAGVNGVAVGGGMSIALNADIRIAAPSARFHPGYTRIAVSPDLGLTLTLPRAVGYERAMRFMLEGRTVSAPEALALGIVSEVVADDADLDGRLLEYGTMLAVAAPIAARQTKRLMALADQPLDLAAHLDLENQLVVAALGSEDSNAAIRAMMTGEPPTFTGR